MKWLAEEAASHSKLEDEMLQHLIFLALIVVIVTIKVKIIIKPR